MYHNPSRFGISKPVDEVLTVTPSLHPEYFTFRGLSVSHPRCPNMSIDLSLNRIRLLLSHLPTYRRPTCHIAGTNGKGSVSALLSSILQASSPPLSVGRFNSPHLLSIRDSIVINNKPVAADLYDQVRGEVEKLNQELGAQASKFEVLASTAMTIFETLGLDIVVMEVGMGGRLDATNAIPGDAIAVSALTSVDLDHQGFLGNTVAEIAREKVGIARRGKPFVLGRQKFPEVEEVVRNTVLGDDIQGHLIRAVEPVELFSEDQDPHGHTPVSIPLPCFPEPLRGKLPLHGSHQLSNLGVASTVVSELLTHPSCSRLKLSGRITPETFASGLAKTTWPGRLSFHALPNGKRILVDGAHNQGSAQTLADFIATRLPSLSTTNGPLNITYILGLSHSPPKEPLDTLAPLFSPSLLSHPSIKANVAALEFFSPDDMPWVKAEPPSMIYDAVKVHCPRAMLWPPSEGKSGLSDALDWATDVSGDSGLVVLAGSLYLVADFYRLINSGRNGL